MIDSFSGSYRFLSNFYPSTIYWGTYKFPTVEHAYQALKSTDVDYRRKVEAAETPGKAKRLGRSVVLRGDWEEIKLFTMATFLMLKFTQNQDLGYLLLRTDDRPLVEGNNWGDTFWGQVDGVGDNNLGQLLMAVRSRLMDVALADEYRLDAAAEVLRMTNTRERIRTGQ